MGRCNFHNDITFLLPWRIVFIYKKCIIDQWRAPSIYYIKVHIMQILTSMFTMSGFEVRLYCIKLPIEIDFSVSVIET